MTPATIGDMLEPFDERLGAAPEPVVLTLTENMGFVPQIERFNKRLAIEDTSNYKVIGEGDVAFNPYLLWAGAIACNRRWESAIVSPAYPTFHIRDGFDAGYVAWMLGGELIRLHFDLISFGAVPRRRRAKVEDFLAVELGSLPPLAEQKRIARILDAADALRTKRRETIEQLDTLLQSVFLDMFGDPVTNPKGWDEYALEDIVQDTKLGLVRSSKEFGWELPTPYVRMDAISADGHFLPDKVQGTRATRSESDAYALLPGDFLFNTRNSRPLVGKVCVFPGPAGWLFNNNIMRIRFTEGVEPTVVAMQFQFERVRRELERRKSGTTSVFAIYWKALRTLPVMVPPTEHQKRFALFVDSVERQKSQLQAHLAELDTLFASLQSRAFRGEL